jgi:hypothetical protein
VETDRQRFRRWLALDTQMKAGEAPADTDRRWWLAYQDTAEYRGLRMAWRDFGEAALGGD